MLTHPYGITLIGRVDTSVGLPKAGGVASMAEGLMQRAHNSSFVEHVPVQIRVGA